MKKSSKLKGRIILILCFIFFIIFICVNISFSHTETSYKKVIVCNGDTLWNLAKYEKNNNMYFENKDIRDIVEIIKTTNSLKNCDISIGDELIIPITYK